MMSSITNKLINDNMRPLIESADNRCTEALKIAVEALESLALQDHVNAFMAAEAGAALDEIETMAIGEEE